MSDNPEFSIPEDESDDDDDDYDDDDYEEEDDGDETEPYDITVVEEETRSENVSIFSILFL